jgi:hypothetical protein
MPTATTPRRATIADNYPAGYSGDPAPDDSCEGGGGGAIAEAPRVKKTVRKRLAAVTTPETVPVPPPRRWPDSALVLPSMEPLATTFGVELEMRPHGSCSGGGWSNQDTGWPLLCGRLAAAGLIDPARQEEFLRLAAIHWRDSCFAGHSQPFPSNHAPYFGIVSRFLHPELIAGLNGLGGSSDAGGDELKTPVLTTAVQTRAFFHSLYSIAPHMYDFNNIGGCGMHIHVGRGATTDHTIRFERYMIAREWLFHLMVPRYRRNGYNLVWRSDTLAGLYTRAIASSSRGAHGFGGAAHSIFNGQTSTFDGDIQEYFQSLQGEPFSATSTRLSPAQRMAVTSGLTVGALTSPLQQRSGHWIVGGRPGGNNGTTEFRLFAPPPQASDIINWIRLLNHIWIICRDDRPTALARSSINPNMSANLNQLAFFLECPNLPADLRTWVSDIIHRQLNAS